MDVVSSCRLPVASLVWQPSASAWALTVVCKATFVLRPGESPLAPEQEAPSPEDEHWNKDAAQSLRVASDLAPMKARAEVVLVGQAFAPGQQPVRSLVARLIVGELDKAIEVHCDRAFSPEGALLEGQRISRLPIVYERAAATASLANPVGIRVGQRDAYGNLAVPNLQPPGTIVATPDDAIDLVGFGPIAASWPSRSERLGRHAATWDPRGWTRAPLPEDFDPAYFNAAPRDQQIAALRDGERLVLENLHHEHASLTTSLASVRPRAVLEGRAGGPVTVAMTPDTLCIDTNRGLCTLTFRGRVALEHPQERGRVVVTVEAARIGFGAPEEPAPAPVPALRMRPQTLIQGISLEAITGFAKALPFGNLTAPAAPPSDARSVSDGGLPFMRSIASAPPEAPVFGAPPPPIVAPSPSPSLPPSPSPSTSIPAPPPMIRPAPLSEPSRPAPSSAWSTEPRAASTPEPPKTVGQLAARFQDADPADTRAAALVGVAAASTAAAGASRVVASIDAPAPRAAPTPAARPAARPEKEVYDLLWFDEPSVPRLRRKAAWHAILDELEQQRLDPELDDPDLASDPADLEDRRDVFEILTRADASEVDAVHDALLAGLRSDGKFIPTLALVAGELSFPFDELETLKATVTTVTPLVAGDEHLKSTLDAAREFLKTPDLLAAPAVAEGLTTRIKDAFSTGKRVVAQGYIEAQTERALLDQRHYQRRSIFKARRIRALLHPGNGAAPAPVYLPDDLAAGLPLYQRFGVRLLVEVHLKADQYESHALAFKALALLRLVPLPLPRK
ncbi:MAG: DUF2169 domain-containing protein [Byssovorax sp.]